VREKHVTDHRGENDPQTHFLSSFLKITPPFITNFTFCNSVTSLNGSPLTATRSAHFPASTVPAVRSSRATPRQLKFPAATIPSKRYVISKTRIRRMDASSSTRQAYQRLRSQPTHLGLCRKTGDRWNIPREE